MHMLHALWFFAAHFDIAITIEHIAGAHNDTADQLSRFNMQPFFLWGCTLRHDVPLSYSEKFGRVEVIN